MTFLSWLRGANSASGNALMTAGLGELDALFSPAKRHQLEHQQAMEMMRDDEESGAPPRPVNLDAGKAVIRVRRATAGSADNAARRDVRPPAAVS